MQARNITAACVAITVSSGFWCSGAALAEVWTNPVASNWNTATNWTPQSVPNGAGAEAIFRSTVVGGDITTGGTVNLDIPVTLGGLTIDMGFAGPTIFLAGNTLTMDAGGAADVTMFTTGTSKDVQIAANIVLMGQLVTDWQASNGQISGSISGDFGITQDTKISVFRLRLWGNNNYTGPTIARKGTISILSAAGLGDHAVGTTIEADGTLIMEGLGNPTITGEKVTLIDRGVLLARPCDWAEEITLVNNGRIAPWFDDYEVTISGKLTGAGAFTRYSAQSSSPNPIAESILHVTNTDNDYTGGTIIDSGILAVSDDAQLGLAGTNITFDQFGFSEGSAALLTTADVTIARDIVMLDPGWLRAEPKTTGSYTGVISGARPLDVGYLNWTGTVDLRGDNTYSGVTTVVAGTLLVNNTVGSGTGTGSVNVQQDAALGGNGTISGVVTVEDGATVAPGSSAGALSVGSATFNTGSFLDIQIGGTVAGDDYDQLNSTGAINLAGTLNVSLIKGYAPVGVNAYDIAVAPTINGTFAVENLPAGLTIEYLSGVVRLHAEGAACPADLTNNAGGGPDGSVDVFDLFVLLANWNMNGAGATLADPPDIVDVFDLFVMLDAWGDC